MRFLSNKEKKELIKKVFFITEISKKDEITKEKSLIYKNKQPFLINLDKNIFLPHLKFLSTIGINNKIKDKIINKVNNNNNLFFKSVYVDKGAIPFIIKGADLMRPGIRKIEENIKKGDIVLIKDENYFKNIAIGISLFDSSELKIQKIGKSFKILHYIGDKYY